MKKHIVSIAFALSLAFFSTQAASLPFLPPVNQNNTYEEEGIKLKLTLGGKTYDLLSYSLNYTTMDKTRLDAMPANVIMNFNIVSVNIRNSKIDQELLDWIFNPGSASKDGQITITDSETGKILKTLTFGALKPNNYSDNLYASNNIVNIQQAATTFSMHFEKINVKLR